MNLSFSIYDDLKQLPAEWHHASKLCTSLQKDYIGIQDISKIENLKNYYLIVTGDNEIQFISYYQLLSVTASHVNLNDNKNLQLLLGVTLNLLKPTLLIAGNLFRHDSDFFYFTDKNKSNEQKKFIFLESINFMIKYTNATGIFIKDIPDEIAASISTTGIYQKLKNDISMEIEISSKWHSIKDYTTNLKHKYLQRFNKTCRSFADVEVKELTESEINIYKNTLYDLYIQVTQKQLVSIGLLNADYFVTIKKVLKNNYCVYGFFLENEMIAFSSAILHEDVYDMNYIGIDYKYNQTHQIYFNMLFHCLEKAIDNKSTKLILGRTAIEAKAIVGCSPDYRNSFYKLRNGILNWFFKKIAKNFSEQQGEQWKDRHPFKSEFYNNKN